MIRVNPTPSLFPPLRASFNAHPHSTQIIHLPIYLKLIPLKMKAFSVDGSVDGCSFSDGSSIYHPFPRLRGFLQSIYRHSIRALRRLEVRPGIVLRALFPMIHADHWRALGNVELLRFPPFRVLNATHQPA
jgi:hypothetical protein